MLWPLGKSSTSDIQLNHLCRLVPVSMSSTERWQMGRGAAVCSSDSLITFVQVCIDLYKKKLMLCDLDRILKLSLLLEFFSRIFN